MALGAMVTLAMLSWLVVVSIFQFLPGHPPVDLVEVPPTMVRSDRGPCMGSRCTSIEVVFTSETQRTRRETVDAIGEHLASRGWAVSTTSGSVTAYRDEAWASLSYDGYEPTPDSVTVVLDWKNEDAGNAYWSRQPEWIAVLAAAVTLTLATVLAWFITRPRGTAT